MKELQEFEAWWDQDIDTTMNPYSHESAMRWAWEAWKAGRAAEREACAKVAEEWQLGIDNPKYQTDCSTSIRARGLQELNKAAEANGEDL